MSFYSGNNNRGISELLFTQQFIKFFVTIFAEYSLPWSTLFMYYRFLYFSFYEFLISWQNRFVRQDEGSINPRRTLLFCHPLTTTAATSSAKYREGVIEAGQSSDLLPTQKLIIIPFSHDDYTYVHITTAESFAQTSKREGTRSRNESHWIRMGKFQFISVVFIAVSAFNEYFCEEGSSKIRPWLVVYKL